MSYAIGHAGTWLAWRRMRGTRAALADNLRPLFPLESQRALERRALRTLRAYARDVIDFLRALDATDAEVERSFSVSGEDDRRLRGLLEQGQGMILVTGHFGNWEIGSVVIRRLLRLPLTILTMREADEDVHRMRRAIRERLGVDTIEVRASLDTALQIRRRLAENRIVAMLMDRHLGRDRVEVSLLGRRAWFLQTPAVLAYLTGAPLVPCFIERIGRGRFAVRAGEPISVAADVPRDAAVRAAAQQFASQLESRIRQQPHYWYHFYRYWDAQDDSYDSLL